MNIRKIILNIGNELSKYIDSITENQDNMYNIINIDKIYKSDKEDIYTVKFSIDNIHKIDLIRRDNDYSDGGVMYYYLLEQIKYSNVNLGNYEIYKILTLNYRDYYMIIADKKINKYNDELQKNINTIYNNDNDNNDNNNNNNDNNDIDKSKDDIFSILPEDMILETINNLSLKDINKLCKTNKIYSNNICNNWGRLLQFKYPNISFSNDMNKDSYNKLRYFENAIRKYNIIFQDEDINNKIYDNIYDNKMLEWASKKGYLDIIKYLFSLPKKYNINTLSSIVYASHSGHINIVKYLLNYYKNNYKYEEYKNNLENAYSSAIINNIDIAKIIEKNINIDDNVIYSLLLNLSSVIYNNNLKAFEYILDLDINMNNPLYRDDNI